MTTALDDESRRALEDEFQATCEAGVEECKNLGSQFVSPVWARMVKHGRALEGARRLVVSGDVQPGFKRLIQAGRPDLTIESTILDPKWHPLFGEDHRNAARWRLDRATEERLR